MNAEYLKSTDIIDSRHPEITDLVKGLTADCAPDPVSKAVKLYYYARDAIRYDPYVPFYLPEHYRASRVLTRR